MTIDIRTATAEQLAEYVLTARGWKQDAEPPFMYVSPDREDYESVESFSSDLNLIADAMPLGWGWTFDGDVWDAMNGSGDQTVQTNDTGNERLDRLRLAALSWEVESKENSK